MSSFWAKPRVTIRGENISGRAPSQPATCGGLEECVDIVLWSKVLTSVIPITVF